MIGTDDQVYTRALDASGQPGRRLRQRRSRTGAATVATRFGNGLELEAFVVGADNQVYAETFDPRQPPERLLRRPLTGRSPRSPRGPTPTATRSLFAVGTDNQLYELKFDASGNAPPAATPRRPAATSSRPSLTHDAAGNPLLYAVGQDDQVYGLKMTRRRHPGRAVSSRSMAGR